MNIFPIRNLRIKKPTYQRLGAGFNFLRFYRESSTKSGQFSINGFTLVEVLIVIGILVILTTLAIPTFQIFQKESDLNDSAEEIINTLRFAQNKTLASEGASQYGVYFDKATTPHQYTLFKGKDFASRDSSFDDVHRLPKSVEIYEINLGGGNEVVFNRISGEASQEGNIKIRLISDPSKIKTISIDSSGRVILGEEVNPAALPKKDSRHVHFDLGWSIQNATNLKFYFPNIPLVETVDTASYFDNDKTEFNWEGTFVIGGVEQVFRAHTHSLDAFNTLLCIHWDRNQKKNNQEVIIYIVDGGIDKDIAHYYADEGATVEKGSYVNTMEIQ